MRMLCNINTKLEELISVINRMQTFERKALDLARRDMVKRATELSDAQKLQQQRDENSQKALPDAQSEDEEPRPPLESSDQ